jgi:P4 family phage/plasmid primase-like protien
MAPEDLITKLAPVEFDPNATCPIWEKFLAEVTGGGMELQEYLQRAVGYSLTGQTNEQVLFLLYGTGANGKSTFLETLRYVFGDYAQTADFSTFTASKGNGPRNDIARLRGARFVTANEGEHGARMAESLIKQVTGTDTISARFLYSESFEFTPQFKLWLATNHKPLITGTEGGIWRRINLVPFTVQIPEKHRDRNLLAKLKAEANGILLWAYNGFCEYQKQGLNPPQVVTQATSQYRTEQDAIASFLAENCVLLPTIKSKARELYSTYKKWAEESGEQIMSERNFKKALTERGYAQQRTERGLFWNGIGIIDQDQGEPLMQEAGEPLQKRSESLRSAYFREPQDFRHNPRRHSDVSCHPSEEVQQECSSERSCCFEPDAWMGKELRVD